MCYFDAQGKPKLKVNHKSGYYAQVQGQWGQGCASDPTNGGIFNFNFILLSSGPTSKPFSAIIASPGNTSPKNTFCSNRYNKPHL